MGSPSLPGDKICKHRVETSLIPMIEEIQDGQICWQSDGYSVFGTTRVYCWWISWKRAQQSMQCYIVQP